MSTNKKVYLPISIEQLIDIYRQHPSMRRVEILKEQLKREKQEDKAFYQSIKAKLTTFQRLAK